MPGGFPINEPGNKAFTPIVWVRPVLVGVSPKAIAAIVVRIEICECTDCLLVWATAVLVEMRGVRVIDGRCSWAVVAEIPVIERGNLETLRNATDVWKSGKVNFCLEDIDFWGGSSDIVARSRMIGAWT